MMSLAGGFPSVLGMPLIAQPKRPTGPLIVAAAVGLTSTVNPVAAGLPYSSTFSSHALVRTSYLCGEKSMSTSVSVSQKRCLGVACTSTCT